MAAWESSAKLRMVAPPLPMIEPHSGVGTSSRSCGLFPSRAIMVSATACACTALLQDRSLQPVRHSSHASLIQSFPEALNLFPSRPGGFCKA